VLVSIPCLISGYYYSGGNVYIAIANGKGKDFKNNLYQVSTNDLSRYEYRLTNGLEIGSKVYAMVRFENGRILMAQSFTVTAGRPSMPILLKEISNTDKEVKVAATKDCTVSLIIGKKQYTSSDYQYDELTDQYIYTFATDRDLSGTLVTVTATNDSGTSDPLITHLIKLSPDSPKVNPIKEKDTSITGTIELLDYKPEEEVEDSESLPKEFEKAPSNVAKTQTRVNAQIDKKTFQGTIDNEGNFTINIPKQSEGTSIRIWGTNKAGRGPLIKVKVTK